MEYIRMNIKNILMIMIFCCNLGLKSSLFLSDHELEEKLALAVKSISLIKKNIKSLKETIAINQDNLEEDKFDIVYDESLPEVFKRVVDNDFIIQDTIKKLPYSDQSKNSMNVLSLAEKESVVRSLLVQESSSSCSKNFLKKNIKSIEQDDTLVVAKKIEVVDNGMPDFGFDVTELDNHIVENEEYEEQLKKSKEENRLLIAEQSCRLTEEQRESEMFRCDVCQFKSTFLRMILQHEKLHCNNKKVLNEKLSTIGSSTKVVLRGTRTFEQKLQPDQKSDEEDDITEEEHN